MCIRYNTEYNTLIGSVPINIILNCRFLLFGKSSVNCDNIHELNEIQLKWGHKMGLVNISIKKTKILVHTHIKAT